MKTTWLAIACLATGACSLGNPDDSQSDARRAQADARRPSADAAARPDARPVSDASAPPDAAPDQHRVLVITGYGGVNEAALVRGALLADARIGAVDTMVYEALNPPPPDLSALVDYDAIVYWWNDTHELWPSSRVSFGNRLADYVDAGGVVVTLAFAQGEYSLLGRILVGGYLPLRPPDDAPYEIVGASTATPTAGSASPLIAGVDEVLAGIHPRSVVAPDAELLAAWDDGTPAAAVRGRVVSVGIRLDPTDVDLAGDWQVLLANAVAIAPGP